jgi:hypothetical protein
MWSFLHSHEVVKGAGDDIATGGPVQATRPRFRRLRVESAYGQVIGAEVE